MSTEPIQEIPSGSVAVATTGRNGSTAPIPLWRRIVFHPLWTLPALVIVTQKLREKGYPFSNFPMYSDPADWDDYIYLTDGEDRPIGIQPHVGLSSAKLNKVFNNTMKANGLKSSAQKRSAPPEVEGKVGREVLEEARRWSENRRRPLPTPVRLYRVIIERDGDHLSERTHLVTEG